MGDFEKWIATLQFGTDKWRNKEKCSMKNCDWCLISSCRSHAIFRGSALLGKE